MSTRSELISRLAAAVERAAHDGLALREALAKRLQLHVTDLRALDVLRAGPTSAGELGHIVGLTSGATTRLVDRLASAGYVRRRHGTEDRRRVLIERIPERMREVDELYGAMAHGWDRLLKSLHTPELERLEEFFRSVHEMTQAQIDKIMGARPSAG